MEDRVRGLVSIKPVVGSLQIYVRSSPRTVDWKEADHYWPYPKRHSYVVQFVSKARPDADEHAECCNDPQRRAD